MEILYKIGCIVLCGYLWRLGGSGPKEARRIGVPVVLSTYFAIMMKWWLFFPLGFLYAITIPLGYGVPDESDPKGSWLGRIFKIGWLTRAMYGVIVSGLGGLAPAFYTGHWWFYVGYIILNFLVGGLLSYFKVKDIIIEPAIGATIGGIVCI